MDKIAKMASQRAVVIFSRSSCSMCHAIKRLFYEQGVSPMIFELDQLPGGREIELVLLRLAGGNAVDPTLPAVLIGGKFVGSATGVMTLQINGTLKVLLKDAGALWL